MLMYCRLCLKQNVEVQDIITSNLKCAELTLIESLYWIFGVEVDINDSYSKFICVRCENVVHYVGSYRTLYRRNQLKLGGILDFQSDDDKQFEQQVPDEKEYYNANFNALISDPILEPKRKWEFIEYYYKFQTTALQELMENKGSAMEQSKPKGKFPTNAPQELLKNKNSKMEHSKLKESVSDSLVHVNGTVNVEVCKYCSQIFKRKKHLETHYKTMHKLSSISDKRRKKNKEKQNLKRFHMARRQIKNKKRLLQNSTNTNRLVIPKKKFLFDTRNFPNLAFMKQLEKYGKEGPIKYTCRPLKQHSSDEIDESPRRSEDVPAFVSESFCESEVGSYDSDSDTDTTSNELKSSDDQLKTIKINDDYLTVSEESTMKLINDQYKWLNLKGVCISIEKYILPTEHQNCEMKRKSHNKLNENERKTIVELKAIENGKKIMDIREQEVGMSLDLLKLNEIRAMIQKMKTLKQKYVNKDGASLESDDGQMQIYDKPLEVEEINLKEKYKHLNLKDCYVSVKKCAIPNGYYKWDNVTKQKVTERKIELVKKQQVIAINADLERVKQWQNSVSAALLRAQEIGSNVDTNFGDYGTADSSHEVNADRQNDNREEQRYRSINGTKWPYLKDFCIAVERCAVPTDFLNAVESRNLKKRAMETELLKEKLLELLDDRVRKNNEIQTKDKNVCKSDYPSNWILKKERSYSTARHLKVKRRKSSIKKGKIQKRDVDIRTCLKKLEIVIPRIDPNLIKYNIVLPEPHQEIFNEPNEELESLAEDMSHVDTPNDMPVLTKEVDMRIDSSKKILNKPPLLEPQVQVPSVPRKLHDIEETERKPTHLPLISGKIRRIAPFEKRLQTSKEGRSHNSKKINDNIYLHKDPSILSVSKIMDLKSVIQSRWSNLRKDNANIISEIVQTDKSNGSISSFVSRSAESNPQPSV